MKRLLVSLLFLLAGGLFAQPASRNSLSVELHGQRFSTELATDDPSRERGLMWRTSLAPDHSMLFVFRETEPRAFWMKNTMIPLDILYFDANRRLVSMQQDVQPCQAAPCPIYPSSGPARYVLELAAGTAQRIGVQMGDELKITGEIGPIQ